MNTLKTGMLLALLTSLIVGVAYVCGEAYGGSADTGMIYAVIALAVCAIMNLYVYWNGDKHILKMYRAEEVGSKTYSNDERRLYEIVERLAGEANIPVPRVYTVPCDSPNAFATGRNPSHASVAATNGLLKLLSDEELEGVMAHELAHVKNYDTLTSTVAATLSSVLVYLPRIMLRSGRGRRRSSRRSGKGGGAIVLLALLAAILAPIISMIIQMAISRGREYVADRDGARICRNPKALASALNRISEGVFYEPMPKDIGSPATAHMCIVNSFKRGGFMNSISKLFSTHPPMEKRIEKLEMMERTRAWS